MKIITFYAFQHDIDLNTAQKIKFSVKNFFSKCDQIHRKRKKLLSYLDVTFTEEILNGKLHFLRSETW